MMARLFTESALGVGRLPYTFSQPREQQNCWGIGLLRLRIRMIPDAFGMNLVWVADCLGVDPWAAPVPTARHRNLLPELHSRKDPAIPSGTSCRQHCRKKHFERI